MILYGHKGPFFLKLGLMMTSSNMAAAHAQYVALKSCAYYYYGKFTRHSRKRVFGYKINAPFKNSAIVYSSQVMSKHVSQLHILICMLNIAICRTCPEAELAPVSPSIWDLSRENLNLLREQQSDRPTCAFVH